MIADALEDGERLAVGRLKADGQAVGDGEYLALQPVGVKKPADGVLHPEGLRPGYGQPVADLGGKIGQQIVIHHICTSIGELVIQKIRVTL